VATAPVADPTTDLDFGGATGAPEQPQSDDKPFDDEPFNAGVEADEESDPKKFIEQLTGKLGQSLRKYNEAQGQPDFELEKFAINSLLSATHTSEMDAEDQKDIIKKVKSAGNTDSGEEAPEEDMDGIDGIEDFNGEEEPEDDVEENILEKKEDFFLKNPKRSSIFAPEGSEEANFKHKIMEKLYETFNQEDSNEIQLIEPAPVKEPKIVPSVIPSIKPSRRNKPFLPSPTVQPDPKAKNNE
jgi:hypothetical protein